MRAILAELSSSQSESYASRCRLISRHCLVNDCLSVLSVRKVLASISSCLPELVAQSLFHRVGSLVDEGLTKSLAGLFVVGGRIFPIVGLMVVENNCCGEQWIDTHLSDKRDVEVETVGKGVDEIDKMAELTDEMQLKPEDQGYVHASNELQLHVVMLVAVCYEVDQHF
ncbi:hypothetical protein Tco_0321622 [Tanacetum coccineum]